MPLFFGVASLSMACALSPTTFVALASGFFFGWGGLWGILMSYPIAAMIGREIGKFLLRGNRKASWLNHQAFNAIFAQLGQQPFRLLVFMRLSPVLPFAMSNFLLAQVQIRNPIYLAGTMVGMLPRTIVALWLGTQVSTYLQLLTTNDSEAHQFSTWLSALLLVISTIGLLFLIRKATKRLLRNNQTMGR